MTPRNNVGGAACHVCGSRKAESVFVDENGLKLLCCGQPCCSNGYRYERPYKPSKQAEVA